MERIAAFWEKGIDRGKTTPDQRESWAANLTAVDDLARRSKPASSSKPSRNSGVAATSCQLDERRPLFSVPTRPPFPSPTLQGDVKTRTGDWHAFFQPCSHHETANWCPRPNVRRHGGHRRGGGRGDGQGHHSREGRSQFASAVWAWCSATKPSVCWPAAWPAPRTSTPPWCWGTSIRWGRWRSRTWSDSTSEGHPAEPSALVQ